MSKPFHILILSTGSLLGQNILDTLEGRRHKVQVTGADCSSGNPRVFRCDKAYKAPPISTPEFKGFFYDLVEKEQPDMILPGRDHDVLELSEYAQLWPEIKKRIPCGAVEAVKIMNNKGLSFRFAKEYNLPFAETFVINQNPNEALSWAEVIGYPLLAKPSEGYGSLGIKIILDDKQLTTFLGRNPQGFILQEVLDLSIDTRRLIENFVKESDTGVPFFFHLPEENQFAGQTIIRPDGSVGEVFTSRSLMVLGRCERSKRWEDPQFTETTRFFAEAIANAGWRGMFNLQCRRTEGGYIGIEMNGRMSGSTSARRWLGYDEIRELILAFYQYDIGADSRSLRDTKGTVYRSLTDYFVSERDRKDFDDKKVWERQKVPSKLEGRSECLIRQPETNEDKEKKRILITGSTGYIGQALVPKLAEEWFDVRILSRSKETARELFDGAASGYYDMEDWSQGVVPMGEIDILLHMGFARPHHGSREIAKSLEFTSELFSRAVTHRVPAIINVSSRSVYGSETPHPWTEASPVAPVSIYGQAKYGAELLLQSLTESNPHTTATSIRLGTVSGGANGLVDVFVLSKFVKQAITGEPIRIVGGSQEFDILDIRDTADALIHLLKTPLKTWKPIYNLTSEGTYNILTLAQICVETASRVNGGIESEILIEDEPVNMIYGMDCHLFYNDMNWKPQVTIEDTIISLIQYYSTVTRGQC